MEKKELRKRQFEELFKQHRMEPDWKFLSGNYAELPEYEWAGFLHSINAILARRAAARNAAPQ